MNRNRPIRFVMSVVGLWVLARMAVILPDAYTGEAEAEEAPVASVAQPSPDRAASARPRLPDPLRSSATLPVGDGDDAPRMMEFDLVRGSRPARMRGTAATFVPGPPPRLPTAGGPMVAAARIAPAALPPASPSPVGIVADRAAAPPARSRWSGNAYLFRRSAGGTPALASGGQLGGSQAGGRVAWAVNRDGPPRIALAARIATPLDDTRGAEAAAGVDWHPLPAAPLRLSVERRIDLGGVGRNAWSAYAAGGFWKDLGRGMVTDGYAQGGIVGARRRDLFADGALRAGHRRDLGGGRVLTLGAGAWAAAQPGVARLDIGPRVAFSLPVARATLTAAAEWRVRVAGDASPRSGPALTLATDF